jgi:hypothetical protein
MSKEREDLGLPSFTLNMEHFDTIITITGFVYGFLLILAAFVSNKVTEAFRIDALFLPKPTEATRKINFIAGAAIIAYNIYSLSSSL